MRTRVAIVAILAALIASPTLAHHRPDHKPRPTPTPTAIPIPTPTPSPTPPPSGTIYGTLLTNSDRAAQEYAAGLRVAGHEAFWDRIETSDGVWNTAELDWKRTERDRHLAAGLSLDLEPGIHYAPGWVYALPNGRYVNQNGGVGGKPNLTWSGAVKTQVEQYLRKLDEHLSFELYDSIRIGAGGDAETLYPSGSLFWAYDSVAQSRTPFPGWKPGQTTLSTEQVRIWYDWYLDELIAEMTWKMDLYRSLGFTGTFHLVMPGVGAFPSIYETAIADRLTSSADVMGRGAAWYRLLERIPSAYRVDAMVWCSSTAESYRQSDYSQAGDVLIAPNDSRLGQWSSMRLMTYYADRLGYGKGGENPGLGMPSDPTYGTTMLDAAVTQVRAGGWSAFSWAHDHNLYDGTGPTLDQYSAAIQ